MKKLQTYLFAVFFLGLTILTSCSETGGPAAPQGAENHEGIHSLQKSGNCVTPPSGLVSWWPADGDALDIVGGNHGTLQNGAAFTSGMVGQAFSFDGVDDIVIAPATGLPAGASPRTVALWVKVDPQQEAHAAAFGYDGEYNGGGFHIFPVSYGGRLFFTGHGSAFDLAAPNDLRDGQYHHVAVTYDNDGTVTIYVDGVAVAARYVNLNTGLSGGVGIGGRAPMFQFLHGEVDEAAVWNRDLSASEIQAIFNAGSAGMCKEVTICHKPGTPAQKTLVIPIQALKGHLGHGDAMGPCQ